MPYKDKEKRKQLSNKRNGRKVEVSCDKCSIKFLVRCDTSKKYDKHFCSKYCKSNYLRNIHLSELNECDFISEYKLGFNSYQKLAKKYKIGFVRAEEILKNNNIEILSGKEICLNMKSEGLGNWLKSKINLCANCGQDFKYGKGRREYYCSTKCYLSDENKFTSIERKIELWLKENNIRYERQLQLENCYFDFLITDCNLIVECDGDYWHGNPKIFKELKEFQKRHKLRDKYKNWLAKNRGYTLIRFWECDINDKFEKVVKKIQRKINEILSTR